MNQQQQNKQAFFAQYCGQKVLNIGDGFTYYVFRESTMDENSHIELRDLKDITDEDAIEVYNLALYDKSHVEFYNLKRKNFIDQGKSFSVNCLYENGCYMIGPGLCLPVVDFLRSRGYLLPFRNYSCEQILEMGWCKLKTK